MSKPMYKQCKLESGGAHWRAWIPVRFAKANKILRIDGHNSPVIVEEADGLTLSHKQIVSAGEDYRLHRKATDI